MIKTLIALQASLFIAVVIQMNPAAAEPKPNLESACYDAGSFPFMLAADSSESEKASPSPTPPKKEECQPPPVRFCSDVCVEFSACCAPRQPYVIPRRTGVKMKRSGGNLLHVDLVRNS